MPTNLTALREKWEQDYYLASYGDRPELDDLARRAYDQGVARGVADCQRAVRQVEGDVHSIHFDDDYLRRGDVVDRLAALVKGGK